MAEDHLDQLGQAFAARVRDWKQQHPQATLEEMDEGMLHLTRELHAQTISELAMQEPEADWAEWPEGQRPRCPRCAVPLHPHGRRTRHLHGYGGTTIVIQRTYGTCPLCQASFFPPG